MDLETAKSYKYLGIEEADGIQQEIMKTKLQMEFTRRARMILGSELNGNNKVIAINSYAVPVIQYSFGIINWKLEEIRKIDRKFRKLLTMHGLHNPKADVDRLYVNRQMGGRGLIQIEAAFTKAIIGLAFYPTENKNQLMQISKQHECCWKETNN